MIVFLDDISVLEGLRAGPGEVARIFDHPLEALLDPELLHYSEEKLVPLGSEDWPYETEFHVRYPLAYFFSFPLGSLTLNAVLWCRLNDSETELLGRLLVGHCVSLAWFSKHGLACGGADSRHSGKAPLP